MLFLPLLRPSLDKLTMPTVVVNGLNEVPPGTGAGEFHGYKDALKVRATPGGIQFMGTRVPVPLITAGA